MEGQDKHKGMKDLCFFKYLIQKLHCEKTKIIFSFPYTAVMVSLLEYVEVEQEGMKYVKSFFSFSLFLDVTPTT